MPISKLPNFKKRCLPQNCLRQGIIPKSAYLKYFQTQLKSAYRQILHCSSVPSSRYCCTTIWSKPAQLSHYENGSMRELHIMTLYKVILLSEGLQFCWCSGKSLITNIHKWIAICIKEHIAKLQHWPGILNNCGRINVLSLCTGY